MFRIFQTSSWLALVLFSVAPQSATSKPTESLSRLSQVDLAAEGDEIQVRIVGSEVPNFTSFTQDDPARVVVDWAGSRLDGVPPEQVFQQGMIRRIAVEQFDAESERISRIALELSQPTTYHVESRGRAIVVRLVRRPDPLPLPPAVEANAPPEKAEKPVEPKPELAAGPLTEPDLPVPTDVEAPTPKKEIQLAKAFRPAPPPAPSVPSYKPPPAPPSAPPVPAMVVARADISPPKPVTPLAPEPPRIVVTPAPPVPPAPPVKPAPVARVEAAKPATPVVVPPAPPKSEPLPKLASVVPATPPPVPPAPPVVPPAPRVVPPVAPPVEVTKAPVPIKAAPLPVLAQAPAKEPAKPELTKPSAVVAPAAFKPVAPAVPAVALAPRPVASEPKPPVVPTPVVAAKPAVPVSIPVAVAARPVVMEPKPSIVASKPSPAPMPKPVLLARYEPQALPPSPEPVVKTVATKAPAEVAPKASPSLPIARLEAPPKVEPRKPPAYRWPQIASRVAVPSSREPADGGRPSWTPPTFVAPASQSRPVARGVVRIESRKEDRFGGGQPVARASVGGKLEPVDSPSDADESDPGPRTIKYVGFNQKDGASRVFVRLDGKAKYRQFRQGDQRIVVEFVNTAVNVKNNTRPLDTSYFETPLTSVQAVPTGDNTRLEITLRGPVTWEVKRIGTTLALDFRSAE